MNNQSDDYDLTHPMDDFARLRKDALETLMDTATDLGLSFTLEEDTMIISLPPEELDDLDVGPE